MKCRKRCGTYLKRSKFNNFLDISFLTFNRCSVFFQLASIGLQYLNLLRSARINVLPHICENLWKKFYDSNEKFVRATVFNMIEEMAPTLSDTLRKCLWKGSGDGNTCSDLFVPILTEEGLCFSFNALNWNEIYTEKYANNYSV